jgi:flavin reductase (DIM6/NTAB) family NADH-FMN oxidoreductase RutF
VLPKLRLITDATPEVTSTQEFADAMGALASGVAIVTCRLDGRPWGMTVTAFASVSADPPTVLVSLHSEATAAHAIGATQRFGVSILAEEQLVVARFGSAPGNPKFLEPFTEAGDGGSASPVVAGALAQLECEVWKELHIADHTVFFARVRAARASQAGALLYHRRDYRTLADPSAADPPTERSTTCLAN